jgi:hypothetical protein
VRALALLFPLSVLVWVPDAWSAEYYIEGPAVEDRAEAVTMSRLASQAGHKARVERRQVDGGWTFSVRIDGFSDRSEAVSVAESLGTTLDQKMQVRDGEEAQEAPTVVSAPRTAAPAPVDSESLIQRAVEAHQETSAALSAASEVLFEFQRRLPDGEVIDHRWVKRGEDRYLNLDVVAGDAVSSRTRVVGDLAFLKVGDADEKSSERIHSLEAIAAFEPTEILPFVLVFPVKVAERRELQLLQLDGDSELEGDATVTLKYEGDRATGPIAVELDAKSYLIRRVIFEGGKLVHQFDGYPSEKKESALPTRVRTWRDGRLADDVEIRTLDLEPSLKDAWFETPGSR